jgi:hypothetical protein
MILIKATSQYFVGIDTFFKIKFLCVCDGIEEGGQQGDQIHIRRSEEQQGGEALRQGVPLQVIINVKGQQHEILLLAT